MDENAHLKAGLEILMVQQHRRLSREIGPEEFEEFGDQIAGWIKSSPDFELVDKEKP